MSLSTAIMKTDIFDTVSATLSMGATSTSITIGGTSTTTTIQNVQDYACIDSNVITLVSQNNTLTIENFIEGGQVINSTYTSATPSTVNNIITINLPTPDARIEGVTFLFRKTRGAINTSSANFTFSTTTNCIVSFTTGITMTGQPTNSISSNALVFRFIVLEYSGTYYWVAI